MLSPDPRRPPEQASDSVDTAPPPVESAGGSEPDPGLTVVRGSSSSAQRRLGAAGPPAPITLPRPGAVIATFLLEEAIGAGGMGAVFRALDTQLDRHVALKLLPPDQAADAEVVQRFYQEGRSAARLDHENIARVFSIGQDGSFHYIAFEYIEGVTLRQRVEASGPVKIAEAVDIALQIAHALVHACERGVVHRDIKPSNIILMPQGRAKLVDMGLARRFERGSDHGLTQSGMTLGTFDYISPEQARDPRDVDVRSDLYSLGCTLFHMLSGRPPFPGGTVLQKLIQHQEELPPDLRSLNPEVPADLAAVITRLMAKDRDRRYQSPEQLVRDLLGVAAALGLERTPAELEYWMARGHRPTWEHHLVWLLPAVGFVVVISGLVWWGREFSKPSTPAAQPEAAALARLPQELNLTGGSAAAEAQRSPASGRLDPDPISSAPAYPRTIPVNSNEDLLAVLATAPRRSVIVLSDDGPYRLGGWNWSARAPKSLTNADLTIKPEPGVRPRLRFAGEPLFPDEAPSCLLQFTGGHVTIEGLEFELDAVAAEEPVAAIRIEGTELTLRGCSFRLNPSDGRPGRDLAALSIRGTLARSPGGERPPALVAESCHFDGGQVVVLAEGPAEVVLRDCTMGPAQPSIWFDNSRAASPIPCELRLLHSSILAGAGPVFRFDGSLVRVWVDDSVIATAGRAAATLLAVDDPRNLVWRGRSNVYSRIGVYLASAGKDGPAATIGDFASWADTTELRESGSRVVEGPVWEAAEPLQALRLERENPTRVFLLSPSLAAAQRGARHGPFGSILLHARPVNRTMSELVEPSAAARRGAAEPPGGLATAVLPKPSPVPPDLTVATATPPAPQAVDSGSSPPSQTNPMDLPSMPPMVPAASGSSTDTESAAGSEVPGLPPAEPAARPEPAKTAPKPSPAAGPVPAVTGVAGEDLIRGSEQFLSRVKRLGRQGGSLWIAAGADLELPTVLLDGMGRVQLRAEPGPRRPRLRFRAPLVPPGSPADWTVLFQVRAGTL
ncbi:MAG TPA: protein kinase, partial [Isosphaeraceae bacterium]|nr:protein kinase [Isosphaeraceae bacterium]